MKQSFIVLILTVVILSTSLVTAGVFASLVNAKSGGHKNNGGSGSGSGTGSGSGSGSGSSSGSGSGTTITDNFQAGGGSNTPIGPVKVANNNNNQGTGSSSSGHKSKHSSTTQQYPAGCGVGTDNSTCSTNANTQSLAQPSSPIDCRITQNIPECQPSYYHNNGIGCVFLEIVRHVGGCGNDLAGAGGSPSNAPQSSFSKGSPSTGLASGSNTGTPPTKCPDGTLPNANGKCAGVLTGGSAPGADVSVTKDPLTGDTIFKKADGTRIEKSDTGTVRTYYPDGGYRVDWSDGHYTLVPGDGSASEYLLNGEVVTSTRYSVTTEMPDGTVITQETPYGNLSKTVTKTPDGAITSTLPNGDYITDKPDGTVVSYTKSDVTTITTKPDGTKITENNGGSWHITFPQKPDGSISTYYENGTTFTKLTDGRTIVH